MNRIVVIRAGALGDTILAFPAVRMLREKYPEARITAVGYPDLWMLGEDLVDEILSIDHSRFAGLSTGTLTPDLAAWLTGTDLVIAWTVRDPRAALLGACIPTVIHASPYPPPGVHAADWLCESIQPLTGDRAGSTPDNAAVSVARRPDLVYIHPGAGAPWKRWPAERFGWIGEYLRRRGIEVVLIEGPADVEAITRVQSCSSDVFPVLRNPSLRALSAIVKSGRLYIGNDSGITHLAAAVGVPTIALFGPTDPVSWAPLGNVRVLRSCGNRATRQGEVRVCYDPDCMGELRVGEVCRAADDVLSAHVENSVENV